MNAQLDFILNELAYNKHGLYEHSLIANSFQRAGYGEPGDYLQRLASDGYIGLAPGTEAAYQLSDKGKRLQLEGGFTHKAILHRESRVALALTVIALVLLTVIASAFAL
jgi:hypothetical protein